MGNINGKSIADIWYGERCDGFRQRMTAVDIDRFATVCGQCVRYLDSKEINEWIRLLKYLPSSKERNRARSREEHYRSEAG